jgi:hypothetical protein
MLVEQKHCKKAYALVPAWSVKWSNGRMLWSLRFRWTISVASVWASSRASCVPWPSNAPITPSRVQLVAIADISAKPVAPTRSSSPSNRRPSPAQVAAPFIIAPAAKWRKRMVAAAIVVVVERLDALLVQRQPIEKPWMTLETHSNL